MKGGILLAVIFLFLAGCATTERCVPCKRQTVITELISPMGRLRVIIQDQEVKKYHFVEQEKH